MNEMNAMNLMNTIMKRRLSIYVVALIQIYETFPMQGEVSRMLDQVRDYRVSPHVTIRDRGKTTGIESICGTLDEPHLYTSLPGERRGD